MAIFADLGPKGTFPRLRADAEPVESVGLWDPHYAICLPDWRKAFGYEIEPNNEGDPVSGIHEAVPCAFCSPEDIRMTTSGLLIRASGG